MRAALIAALVANATAQGINGTTVFAFYELATTADPTSYAEELFSYCGLGAPYCDAACDGSEYDCSMLAATWCAERVVLSGNASACQLVRFYPGDGGGRAAAFDARGLPLDVVGEGDSSYFAMVVYDGAKGPFVKPTTRDFLPPIVADASPAPVSNRTAHTFYEVEGSGAPYNASAPALFSACARGCAAPCDGSANGCVPVVAAWCDAPESPCAVVSFADGAAIAGGSERLPPVNVSAMSGPYTFWIDVAHPADVGPPPAL